MELAGQRTGRIARNAIVTLLAAAAAASPAWAAPRALPPVRISGASPFAAGCAAKEGITDTSTVQYGAEVEPSLTVDPRDRRVIVAEYQQDRIKTGSSLGDVVAVSHDGGRTFTQHLLPGTSACEGGAGTGTDPVVSFGPDGVVYAATQVDDGYMVSRSSDGGVTWKTSRATTTGALFDFDDKETLVADPTRPGHVYLAWDDLFGPDPVNGAIATLRFTSSTDGGKTWGRRQAAFQPLSPLYGEAGPELVVRPNGDLVIVFSEDRRDSYVGLPPQPHQLMAIRSTDAGASWSSPVLIATVPPLGSEVNDPGNGDCVRTGGDCPTNHLADGLAVAVEPDGAVDAVWQQDETKTSGTIMLSRSTDGVHWSARRPAVHLDTQVFLPAVAAQPDGTLGLSYYAFRPYTNGDPTVDTDVWLTTSTDHGQSFAAPVRLAGPFDIRRAPVSTTESVGRFLGDYDGLVALPDGFGVDFAASAPLASEGASDVFFSHVVTAPARAGHHRHHPKRRHTHRHARPGGRRR